MAFAITSNPNLKNSDKLQDFDRYLVDAACLIAHDGKNWCYCKARQLGKPLSHIRMGVAIADRPRGSYVNSEGNAIIQGNHEVLVWP